MTAVERVLDALAAHSGFAPRRTGTGWTTRCPAHDDHNPSLSVTNGDGRVLLRCQAGCDTEDVVAAINMTMADLFDQPRDPGTSSRPNIVATYDYTDEAGELLYQVVRLTPKSFRQRRPDGKGSWIWRLDRTRRVLYRLPKILDAVANGETIYLVEGEKDVHAIEAAGGTATTNPGGAGKWRSDYTDTLRGAHVIIIADRDQAGYTHAQTVAAALSRTATSVRTVQPAAGKDPHDHLTGGHSLDDFTDATPPAGSDPLDTAPADDERPDRRLVLTPASTIRPRRVHWCWDERIARGTLALLAGPEGLGKSTMAYWLAARITRGELPGEDHGTPRAVLVCATEDSWEHTIVPRLMATGADLTLVYRVEVKRFDDITIGLSLPRDLADLRQAATDTGAALLILDPLMSRLSEALDTHKDGEVRRALEPLVGVADDVDMAIVGLIHHNKSGSSDPLSLVMASKAFTAVARSVHTIIKDPDDETETRRLFGTPKNNLGRIDLPVLSFTITRWTYDTDDGPGDTGQLIWGADVDGTIGEAIRRATEDPTIRSAVSEARDWLSDYMYAHGPRVPSEDIKRAAEKAGHAIATVKRARQVLRVQVEFEGFPRRSYWVVSDLSKGLARAGGPPGEPAEPNRQSGQGISTDSNPYTPTAHNEQSAQLAQWEQAHAPTRETINPVGDPIAGPSPTLHGEPWTPEFEGQCPPFQPGNFQGIAPCPDCGWALDSQAHDLNCEGGRP